MSMAAVLPGALGVLVQMISAYNLAQKYYFSNDFNVYCKQIVPICTILMYSIVFVSLEFTKKLLLLSDLRNSLSSHATE